MRIGIAQINPTLGDLKGNADRIVKMTMDAARCDLVVFPEMALTGYPPEDLLLKPSFIRDNAATLKKTAARLRGRAAIVGFVDAAKGRRHNAAAWIENGRVAGVYHKQLLPNYGVLDEKR
jgi:NAD+ synthase (glutamine-hydrolysing)